MAALKTRVNLKNADFSINFGGRSVQDHFSKASQKFPSKLRQRPVRQRLQTTSTGKHGGGKSGGCLRGCVAALCVARRVPVRAVTCRAWPCVFRADAVATMFLCPSPCHVVQVELTDNAIPTMWECADIGTYTVQVNDYKPLKGENYKYVVPPRQRAPLAPRVLASVFCLSVHGVPDPALPCAGLSCPMASIRFKWSATTSQSSMRWCWRRRRT